jgi:hypothetical protein
MDVMLYFKGTNTGKGFITHADHEEFEIYEHGEVFVTDSGSAAEAWGVRNGLESITKEEAQAIVDTAVQAYGAAWDLLPDNEKEEIGNDRPETEPLP